VRKEKIAERRFSLVSMESCVKSFVTNSTHWQWVELPTSVRPAGMSLTRSVKTALRRRRGHVVEFVRHGRAARPPFASAPRTIAIFPSSCLLTYLNADIFICGSSRGRKSGDVVFELQKNEVKRLKSLSRAQNCTPHETVDRRVIPKTRSVQASPPRAP
jgi:hypothetical protein